MDVNGDGNIDILSGSYSRHSQPMAGLFQVLYGTRKGTFAKATILNGADDKPLIVPANEKNVVDKICTRPTMVDIDADGHMDIVTGNFAGTFALFKGLGKGKFEPKPTWIMAGGQRLKVSYHSDPFFVDWDQDGDLDMVSGASSGGVFLIKNNGTREQAEFAQPITILKAAGYRSSDKLGDTDINSPQTGTRVYVDDVNGDGKFDLLVGDNVSLNYPAKGVDPATIPHKLEAWRAKQKAASRAYTEASRNKGPDAAGARKQARDALMEVRRERAKILRTERTGFVWVMYQK